MHSYSSKKLSLREKIQRDGLEEWCKFQEFWKNKVQELRPEKLLKSMRNHEYVSLKRIYYVSPLRYRVEML